MNRPDGRVTSEQWWLSFPGGKRWVEFVLKSIKSMLKTQRWVDAVEYATPRCTTPCAIRGVNFCISLSPSLSLQLLVNQLSYLSCNSGFESSTDMIYSSQHLTSIISCKAGASLWQWGGPWHSWVFFLSNGHITNQKHMRHRQKQSRHAHTLTQRRTHSTHSLTKWVWFEQH